MRESEFPLRSWRCESQPTVCRFVGPENCHIISADEDCSVSLWDGSKSSLPECVLTNNSKFIKGNIITSLAASYNSTEIVTIGTAGGSIRLWNTEIQKILTTLSGHRTECTCLDHHPCRTMFASSSLDTSIRLWDLREHRNIHVYKQPTGFGVACCRYAPSGNVLASGGHDGMLTLWDLRSGRGVSINSAMREDTKSSIIKVSFHPKKKIICTLSTDKTVKLHDLSSSPVLLNKTIIECKYVCDILFIVLPHLDSEKIAVATDSHIKFLSATTLKMESCLNLSLKGLFEIQLCTDTIFGSETSERQNFSVLCKSEEGFQIHYVNLLDKEALSRNVKKEKEQRLLPSPKRKSPRRKRTESAEPRYSRRYTRRVEKTENWWSAKKRMNLPSEEEPREEPKEEPKEEKENFRDEEKTPEFFQNLWRLVNERHTSYIHELQDKKQKISQFRTLLKYGTGKDFGECFTKHMKILQNAENPDLCLDYLDFIFIRSQELHDRFLSRLDSFQSTLRMLTEKPILLKMLFEMEGKEMSERRKELLDRSWVVVFKTLRLLIQRFGPVIGENRKLVENQFLDLNREDRHVKCLEIHQNLQKLMLKLKDLTRRGGFTQLLDLLSREIQSLE